MDGYILYNGAPVTRSNGRPYLPKRRTQKLIEDYIRTHPQSTVQSICMGLTNEGYRMAPSPHEIGAIIRILVHKGIIEEIPSYDGIRRWKAVGGIA